MVLVHTCVDRVSIIQIVFGLADGTFELILELLWVLLLDLRGKRILETVLRLVGNFLKKSIIKVDLAFIKMIIQT
jgi:hypothetical protein